MSDDTLARIAKQLDRHYDHLGQCHCGFDPVDAGRASGKPWSYYDVLFAHVATTMRPILADVWDDGDRAACDGGPDNPYRTDPS